MQCIYISDSLKFEKNDLISNGSNDSSIYKDLLLNLDVGDCKFAYASSSNLKSLRLSNVDKKMSNYLEFRYLNDMADVTFQVEQNLVQMRC